MSLGPYPTPEHVAGARGPAGEVDADVIILAMDRAEETVAAIASARAQAGLTKHVWIADQGSKPENLARLAAAVEGGTGGASDRATASARSYHADRSRFIATSASGLR